MTIRLHSVVLASVIAATAAVGIAGASVVQNIDEPAAPKGDRLDMANCQMASLAAAACPADAHAYITVEERGDGVSTLIRVPSDS
jgi:hypothetical protein